MMAWDVAKGSRISLGSLVRTTAKVSIGLFFLPLTWIVSVLSKLGSRSGLWHVHECWSCMSVTRLICRCKSRRRVNELCVECREGDGG